MKAFLLAGLIAAIGVVALVGTAQAADQYCRYNAEDPQCRDGGNDQRQDRQYNSHDDGDVYGDLYEFQGRQQYQDGWNQNDGQAFYDGERKYDKRRSASDPRVKRVGSCVGVGRSLRDYGYRRVRIVDCEGKNYKYVAFRGYQRFMVKVDRFNGRIRQQISY